MKYLQVACAIIMSGGKIFATRRSESMSMPLKWEFPGGKIRNGERPDECLKRELMEELGVEVVINRSLSPTTYRYPTFIVMLHPFVCTIAHGEITLYEHAACSWVWPDELHTLDWAEADRPLIKWCREEFKIADGDQLSAVSLK